MFSIRLVCALGASLLLAASSHAADLGVSAEIGTTGVGAHLTVPVAPSLNLRAGMNYLRYSTDRSVSSINYDMTLKLHTVDLLADWYVSPASSFRLTAGAVYNNTTFDANALPGSNGSYTINGRPYSAATVGKLSGDIAFRKVAPYLGLGWGNAVAPGSKWRFTSDLGVTFQGKPKVRLSNTGCTALAAACNLLVNDIAVEQAKLADDVDSMRLYPVLRVGLSYRF